MFPMNAAGLPLMNVGNLYAAAQLAALNPLHHRVPMMAPMPGAALLGIPRPAQQIQPMQVPPGMGNPEMANSPPAGSRATDWTEHRHEDGRTFYYNNVTRQSVWRKPPELMTPSERASAGGGSTGQTSGAWKEYATSDGKKYYYNTESKETTWTMPEGFVINANAPSSTSTPNPTAAVPATESPKVEAKKDDGAQSALEKSMAATLAALPPKDLSSGYHNVSTIATISDVPMIDPETELKNRQRDRFNELLRDKYNDGKITATCNWDKAVPFIQGDPRFRILTKVSEKKQLFNAWKVQRQKEERDEKRIAIKKAKEDLEEWLSKHARMKNPNFRYGKANEIFSKETVWHSVHDDDRREIFNETQRQVLKREDELKRTTTERNKKMLMEILSGMCEVTCKTTWAQAQRLLIENPDFSADITIQGMDKMDALKVFEDHIKELEKKHDEDKQKEEMLVRRGERKTREAFTKLLTELHEKSDLMSVSLWSTLYTRMASDARFDAMLMQSGSTPLDLFKFFVEDLKEQFGSDRKIIKDILAAQGKSVAVTTTPEELIQWVHSDDKGKQVDMGNLKLYYNSLIEKAENKEKEIEREEARKKRRLESEFRNLLRTLQPPIETDTQWTAVRVKIEKESAFTAIASEEEREALFKAFAAGPTASTTDENKEKEKKKEDEKKKEEDKEKKEDEKEENKDKKKKKKEKKKKDKRDSESEGESRSKKKKRKHDKEGSSDEEKEKKKKKKSKRSASPSSPHAKRARSRSRSE